jgi:hypothetical protein
VREWCILGRLEFSRGGVSEVSPELVASLASLRFRAMFAIMSIGKIIILYLTEIMSSIPSSQSMLDANQVKMIQNENLSLKISLDKANRELDDVLMENDKHREKISELEKWIVMLLNNFYSGTPQTL